MLIVVEHQRWLPVRRAGAHHQRAIFRHCSIATRQKPAESKY
jgi:hypothetical protein